MNFTWGRQGWTCPGCSRCYSPDVMMCWFCPTGTYTFTWPPVHVNPLGGTGVAPLTVGPEGVGVVPLTFTSPTAIPRG